MRLALPRRSILLLRWHRAGERLNRVQALAAGGRAERCSMGRRSRGRG